jgi:colanic acid biosynthesis glycosyl transferase WcaI
MSTDSKAKHINPFQYVALLISIYFPPEPGGGSTAAWNRASILRKMGYSVFVITSFPSYPSGKISDPKYKGKFLYIEKFESFTLIRLRLLPLESAGYLRRLVIFLNFTFFAILCMPKILRIAGGRVDLVYSIAPIIFSSFCGFVYSKITRSFFVYEVSDLWPDELTVFKTKFLPILMVFGRTIAKLSYIGPHMIISISELAAEHVSREYNPKVPIHPLPIGVDTSKFQSLPKNKCREELIRKQILPGELQNKFIILYAGLISNATRVDNLAYAADKIRDYDKQGRVAILVVGDGHEKVKLEQLKHEYKLDNFYLLPFQPREIMPTIISAADVCTVSLPSDPIFDVDVPSKFYEYLACCKPFIGICGGEPAKIINSYNIGLTTKAGDINGLVSIIRTFLDSPNLLHSMENNCSVALQKYSLDSLATYFLTILKKERNNKRKITEPFNIDTNNPTML